MEKTRRDLALSLGSQLGFKLLGFLILALLARHLAQEDFGRLSLALALCTLCVLFTDLGYNNELIRQIAREPHTQAERLGRVLSTRIPLLLAFLVFVNIAVYLSKPELLLITLGISASVGCKDLYRSVAAVFVARRKIDRNILSFGSGLVVILLSVFVVQQIGAGVNVVVLAYVAGSLTTLLLAVWQYRRNYDAVKLSFSFNEFQWHVFSCFPLFALTAMNYAHFSIDSIALGYLRPYKEVALFAASAQLLEASQFAIRPFTLIMYPICAMLCMQSRWQQLTSSLVRLYLAAIAMGIGAGLFVMVYADLIIEIVFSSLYADSAQILRLLYLSVPGLFVTAVGVFVASALHREHQACIAIGTGLGVKVLLYIAVVPKSGSVGVAWLNLVTQSLIGSWLMIDSFRTISYRRQQTARKNKMMVSP